MKRLLLLLILTPAACIQAQWSNDPDINNPICTQNGYQLNPLIASDGSGGAIIVWEDQRTAIPAVYAQRIDFNGEIKWTVDGLPVCGDSAVRCEPGIVSDGCGGAIITWTDFRNGFPDYDIYAQRINPDGELQWDVDGIPVCSAPQYQMHPKIVSDGDGGAIITWVDHRGGTYIDLYAQRINALGAVQWSIDGIKVSSTQNFKANPAIACDGMKGALITWDVQYTGYDIYAQRIDSSGMQQWSPAGIIVCDGSIQMTEPASWIIPDGTGGAVITWTDSRNNLMDIYAQKVSSGGTVQWQTNGVPVCTSEGEQSGPSIVTDDSGGAIIAWLDGRYTEDGIYAQHINSDGAAGWTPDGVRVFSNNMTQDFPAVCSDGAGGVVIAICDFWRIYTDGNLYAQRINPNGVLQWPANGIPVSTASDVQFSPALVTDGNEGAVITWMDNRTSGIYNSDIYASWIDKDGNLGNPVPVNLTSFNAVVNGGCVILNWSTETETNNRGFEIERSQKPASGDVLLKNRSKIKSQSEWLPAGFVEGNGTTLNRQSYTFKDVNLSAGLYQYRLKQIDFNGAFKFSNMIDVNINVPYNFSLSQNYPNPFNPKTKISWQSPAGSWQTLKIYDVLGNNVATLVNEYRQAGKYEMEFNAASLPGGVYFYQLKAGGFVQTKKMTLLK